MSVHDNEAEVDAIRAELTVLRRDVTEIHHDVGDLREKLNVIAARGERIDHSLEGHSLENGVRVPGMIERVEKIEKLIERGVDVFRAMIPAIAKGASRAMWGVLSLLTLLVVHAYLPQLATLPPFRSAVSVAAPVILVMPTPAPVPLPSFSPPPRRPKGKP